MPAKLNILVVDSHHDSADSLADLFRIDGHTVQVAYTPEDAVRLLQAGAYNIGFLDTESYRQAKDVRPEVRLYMMTGHSVEQLLKTTAEEAPVELVARPQNPRAVIDTLDGLTTGGVVLVAEDDPDLGPQLRQLVASSGRRCELVANGKDAIERVEKGGVEVLILDINMPLVNGIEVYTTLKDGSLSIPTVMITACSDQFKDAMEALSDIERTGILHKPFDPDALLAKLERLAA
jgi:DNA-binding response OmpR family regulator